MLIPQARLIKFVLARNSASSPRDFYVFCAIICAIRFLFLAGPDMASAFRGIVLATKPEEYQFSFCSEASSSVVRDNANSL